MSTATLAPARAAERRRLALIAGWSLLTLAVLAGLATFGVIERLRPAADLAGAGPMLRLAAAALLVVAVLDLVVAWALHEYFAPVNRPTFVGEVVLLVWLLVRGGRPR